MRELLKCLPYWNSLTNDEKRLCEERTFENSYNKGEHLLGDCNGSCRGMIHVISGELRAYIVSEDGREITLFHIGENENCVLSASCVLSQITFDTRLCVTKSTRIFTVPSDVFGSLIENNIYVRCFAYELATKRFSSVMWVMHQILFYGFDKRLAGFLADEYLLTGKKEIHMTQEELAQGTNSAREVVARMLKHFADDGLIESRRGTIIIKNAEGLIKISGKHTSKE